MDVGGTNTDAVVVDGDGRIIIETKTATTPEPIDGIVDAITTVIDQVDDTSRLGKAMLGTTHPTNAIIRRRDLDRVGVLRLAAPSSLGVRPSANWPDDLRDLVIGRSQIIEGGFEYGRNADRTASTKTPSAASQAHAQETSPPSPFRVPSVLHAPITSCELPRSSKRNAERICRSR